MKAPGDTARESAEVLIIGAGPTGLGAAWRLASFGHHDWCLCEAAPTVGGLAGSVIDVHGFTWDFGGHVQHSHYGYFDDLMDELLGPDGWLLHEREAWIWIDGRFVPYPFQLNLHRLSDAARDECLAGLIRASASPLEGHPAHFGQWVDRTFGAGIARWFMRPYNEKVWACPLEEMDWRWIGDRVALVDLPRAIDNVARQRDDTGWGPNSRFRFPRRGGTGAVWNALGHRLHHTSGGTIRLSQRVIEVDTIRHAVRFENGQSMTYGRLLTTMPLDELVRLSDLGEPPKDAASRLRYTSTHVLGFALHGTPPAILSRKCWMYFPEDAYPFYRVTVFSHYSPDNVPDATRFWSLLVEVSERPGTPAHNLEERTLQGLLAAGLVESRGQVHHVWHRRLEHGYPVPTLGRDAALREIHAALEARDVYSRGRFGAWKYEVSNQDHSLAQGVELVNRWMTGFPERTLINANGINERGRR